jgi:O-antigen ligase
VWELLVALFAGYVLARFAGGGNHSMAALRDLTPYAYSAVALLAGRAYLAAGRRPRAATGRFLSAVTLLHLSWVALVVLIPAIPAVTPALPGSHGLTIFTLRPDFDGAVLGLTAGLRLVRFLRGGRAVNGLIVLVCLGLSASMPSRAGVLAALAAAVTAVALTMCARPETATGAETAAGIGTAAAATTEIGTGDPGGRGQRRRRTAVTLLLVAVAALGMVAPMTTAGSKLLAGFGLQPPSNTLDSAGIGTTHARETAWHAVLGYVDETHSRALGVGFGVNIVNAAGATSALSGSLLVRSPHNYLVGLYARTGLVGVALFLGIVVAAIGAVLTLRRDIADDPLLLAATLAPAAILTSAVMGVVLESPFGAVPFFWSVGVLLGARAERVAQRTAAPATPASVTRASVTPVAVTPGATPAPAPSVRAVAGVPLRQ